MNKLTIAPSIDSMAQVLEFVEQSLEAWEVPMKITLQMGVAVDEIFSNIAHYSQATTATVEVGFQDGEVLLRFADNGTPYDPTKKPDPDITLSAEERGIGGLGIYMVKKSMDQVLYAHRDGLNILTLRKSL